MLKGVRRKKLILLFAVTILMLLNCSAFGAPEAGAEVQEPLELPSVAGLFFRIIISMFFILLITYAVMRLLKRQNDLQQRQKAWIRVLDYQGLGANRGIYLMEILNRDYLVGVSEGSINILLEIDQDDEYWRDIKDTLEEGQAEILPKSIEKLVTDGLGRFKAREGLKGKSFENQLDKQLGRTNRLYDQLTRGGKDSE